jgi:GDPmannose 4,6-dehydratase
MKRVALIIGVSGQDGSLLARHLLTRGWVVHGTSRDAELNDFRNLVALGIRDQVELHSVSATDFRSVVEVIEQTEPEHIYSLGGQSSVALSFTQPIETHESIAVATLNVLEAIRLINAPVRFYNAASSECYGNTSPDGADENTPFHPRSPYAVAKASAFWAVANYRESYGLFAASGILFNHESPLRPERFVTQKIVREAAKIARGLSSGPLQLGNLDVCRDWGWAEDYVEAMPLLLLRDTPEDFVVATGESATLRTFTAEAFAAFGLDWRDHVQSNPQLLRPADIMTSVGRPMRARENLGWQARTRMPEVVRRLAASADAALSPPAKHPPQPFND